MNRRSAAVLTAHGALVAALDGGKRIVALGAGDQNLLAFALFSIAAVGGIVALAALVAGGFQTARLAAPS